ncbi:hypothetical protein Adt_20458 [Abeliophyllum distichum]|uniref:Uncharacterized protein n=1 Tax=Abeliophyllum distichum TaxID=126358 RepID=A0ABD1SWK8_9LAMI
MKVLYVGSLSVDVDPIKQDDVANYLLKKFNCVPAFLPPNHLGKYYDGLCKKQLWPLFHYMLPFSAYCGVGCWAFNINRKGDIGLEYYGRNVVINIMSVGIHMGHTESAMKLAEKEKKFEELKHQFEGKTVLLGAVAQAASKLARKDCSGADLQSC